MEERYFSSKLKAQLNQAHETNSHKPEPQYSDLNKKPFMSQSNDKYGIKRKRGTVYEEIKEAPLRG